MNVRAFLAGISIGLLFAFTPGCGTSTKKCLRSNCAGCCDMNDECQAGTQGFACGADGRTCSTCLPGQGCTSGVCSGTPSTGGGQAGAGTGGGAAGVGGGAPLCANCNGCCDNGACRGGNTSTACGRGGQACTNCQSQNRACSTTGECITFVCPGCVLDGGTCAAGTTNLACGSDAGVCRQCGAGQSCFNGACTTATTCGPANCNGCCDGTVCIQAPTTAQCGSGGSACQACTGAQQCIGGTCLSGSGGGAAVGGGSATSGGSAIPIGGGLALPCNALTCADGCCDAAGACQPGDSSSACGLLGRSCESCRIACVFKNCL